MHKYLRQMLKLSLKRGGQSYHINLYMHVYEGEYCRQKKINFDMQALFFCALQFFTLRTWVLLDSLLKYNLKCHFREIGCFTSWIFFFATSILSPPTKTSLKIYFRCRTVQKPPDILLCLCIRNILVGITKTLLLQTQTDSAVVMLFCCCCKIRSIILLNTWTNSKLLFHWCDHPLLTTHWAGTLCQDYVVACKRSPYLTLHFTLHSPPMIHHYYSELG